MKMFLTDRTQLFLSCYLRKEKMGKGMKLATSSSREATVVRPSGHGRAAQAPAATAHTREPKAPSVLSAALPRKLGKTCWK